MKFIRHKALYDPNLRKLQDECSWRSERLPRDALRLDSVCRFNGLYHLCHLRSTIFEPYSPYSRTETCGTDPPVGSPPRLSMGWFWHRQVRDVLRHMARRTIYGQNNSVTQAVWAHHQDFALGNSYRRSCMSTWIKNMLFSSRLKLE